MTPPITNHEQISLQGERKGLLLRTRRADLDGLRGIAILLTIFLHYVSRGGYFLLFVPDPIAMLLDSFWSGVDIFFVLSGFLIGGIIIDKHRAENFFRVFYLRRALRILPVALATIAIAYLVLPAFGVGHPTSRQVQPLAYLLFINNYWTATGVAAYPPLGPMWSLAIEEQFYLLAPTLFLFVGPNRCVVIAVLVILASPFLRLANLGFSSWDFTLFRLDGFSAGMLVAIMLRNEQVLDYAAANRLKVRFFTIGFTLATLAFSLSSDFSLQQRIAFGISLNSLAAASVIAYLGFYEDSQLRDALSRQWLVTLGRLSYFLYLMHIPVLLCMKASGVPRSFQPVAALLLCLAGAWASWRYIETPLINISKKQEYAE